MSGERIVFAGGGHAHLYSLARTRGLVQQGFDVTLVDRCPHLYYSGMATGVISGAYAPEEHRIDTRRLVEEAGGRFVQGRITAVRTDDREFVLEDGRTVPYDAGSVCLGSGVSGPSATGDGSHAVAVKPVSNALEVRRRLVRFDIEDAPRILVIGGGAAGCEVAANMLVLLERLGTEAELTLAHSGESLLPAAPARAQRGILTFLRERGARVRTGVRVSRLDDGTAWTSDGREIPYDLAVVAAGVSPPTVFGDSRLPTDEAGGLLLDRHLRSVGDARLFGGGDCVSLRGLALPNLAVFAVRQGPVIFHNVQAALTGSPLREYRPQSRYLYVLNLGDSTGLAVYGGLSWRGRLSWWLKHRIDKRFVGKHSG